VASRWLNYGIATDRLLVIDVDPRSGGDKAWEKMWRQPTRYLPHTWEVITGGEGRHVLFANPAGIKGGTLTKGVDLKGVGGYIVGVGSRHISGNYYRWAPQCSPKEATLHNPPQWLLDEIGKTQSKPGERKPSQHWDELLETGFVDGTLNNNFIQIIGHLIGCRVDPELAWHAVRCINLCAPDPGDELKIEALFDRIVARECNKRGL
jgi:Bifunctional DNA primase/polymerase, N-terminal